MSAFASIKQGLEEDAAHARGAPSGVLEHRSHAVDVAELRRRLGLTQNQFAGRFGFSVAAPLGARRPHAPGGPRWSSST
jgi:putative transcriptional regulator